MRLFVAESDPALGAFLKSSLEAEGYAVDLSPNGAPISGPSRALPGATDEVRPDAVVLDLNTPTEENLALLRRLRNDTPSLPILALTSRGRREDRVRVLDGGADDLVVKPFAFSELSARLRALLRRGGTPADMVLRIEDLELSRVEHTVTRGGRKIDLTPKEFALLEYLMRNAGQRVTRAEIIGRVWNLSFNTMTNVVDVYINYLRKKVDAASDRKLIHTIRGIGYQLRADPVARRGSAATSEVAGEVR
jgi:two-component system, OmpR family, copper resistance phosphate regulon response regulator CusR